MHEISLVRNMLDTLEDAYPGRIQEIMQVTMKAGLLSNVQPILMQNALDAVVAESPEYAGIRLELEILPILIHCDACDKITEVQHYRFICTCGKPSKNMIQGDELMISQVMFK